MKEADRINRVPLPRGDDSKPALNRRDFLKLGVAGAVAGSITTSAAFSKDELQELDSFPNLITDQCQPFDHKYHYFCSRSLGAGDAEKVDQICYCASHRGKRSNTVG